MFNQGPWGYSSTDDREDDDEREPEEGVKAGLENVTDHAHPEINSAPL
jgi:hypothetical protein